VIEGRRYCGVELPLPRELPYGYHELEAVIDEPTLGESRCHTRLIVTPERAWLPHTLSGDGKLAGFSGGTAMCGPSAFCLVLNGGSSGANAAAALALIAAYRGLQDQRYLRTARCAMADPSWCRLPSCRGPTSLKQQIASWRPSLSCKRQCLRASE